MDSAAHPAGFHALYAFPGFLGFFSGPIQTPFFRPHSNAFCFRLIFYFAPWSASCQPICWIGYGINSAVAAEKSIADMQYIENPFFSSFAIK
jgi:hypothetical protein